MEKNRNEKPDPIRTRKGVALIMVLTVVVILTVVSVEFQYESRVYMQTTGNFRDRLRAKYLARSAIEFTRLLLYLQGTVDQMIKRFWKKNPPNIQLWQMIPVDSDLARAVAGGMFSMQDEQSLFKNTVAGAGLDDDDSMATKQADQMNTLAFDKAEGFGDFEGHFHADIIDEESKININIRPGNFSERKMMKSELERLFSPAKYNPFFENPDENGEFHDRQEIINAIVDWIDPDDQRSGFESGDESSRYDFLDDKYPSKNHLFDSLNELQLVAGIGDRFWRLFADSLTVYRTKKININTCGPEVMRALLEQYLEKPLPQENEMQSNIDKIMDFRIQNSGFWNEDGFINFITGGPELFLELEHGARGKTNLRKAITVSSGTFLIKAEGDINGVMVTLRTVMTKSGQMLYYREE